MLSFLPSTRNQRPNPESAHGSPFAGSPETGRQRAVAQSLEEGDYGGGDGPSPFYRPHGATSYFDRVNGVEQNEELVHEEHVDDGDESAGEETTPLLPIFSSAHLDRLPLYNITHAIRLLVVQKCETTLSWDQLRSPQISQFLVKPIQNQIRANHFNRATLCALIANCLQFQKECQLHPANIGVSRTRALISELLAMRLIKEYSTRELIDALSYDFDPLQGMSPPSTAAATGQRTPGWATPAVHQDLQGRRVSAKGARVSTIEIAIRAQSKRFLAHPVVVQHLEAIWAGTIVFHSEADNLHRKPSSGEEPYRRRNGYGTVQEHASSALPADSVLSRKARDTRTNKRPALEQPLIRRSVTLYNPRDASLFKLSRLRVPRYRQIFSTLSFATMLGLFLAVLVERSLYITPLEVVFWFWSIGYMLDEVVGFTEQGFGLYLLSFWNTFDLGILLLFIVYYCLRLYGIVLAEQGKLHIADTAYDVLATTAVLLFPRVFSVLDHYRYFSQLLIAFRMMAQDLAAILILILISCSGFFVAFTLSFSDKDTDASSVAYALFQILMGFTPAAWEKWSGYNVLGKGIMTAFLIICHFLIVTILITVLTNSFMAIVQNANEEHQFLFAVNTISMVKSDALFSYIAPTNVIGWILSPLRYIIPFQQYVRFNRTTIKATHFPILFIIFAYERIILAKFAYEPTDLVERPSKSKSKPLAFTISKAPEAFDPSRRLREPSVISFHKDRALEEVFRRPFRGSTVRTTTQDVETERRKSVNAVDKWMQLAENEGGASPPLEQPRSVLERLEHRRPRIGRAATADKLRLSKRSRDPSATTRSLNSDPDIISTIASRRPYRIDEETEDLLLSNDTLPQETDADGDDENNGESDNATPAIGESAISTVEKENRTPGDDSDESELFQTPVAGKPSMVHLSAAAKARLQYSPDVLPIGNSYQVKPLPPQRNMHSRNASTGTTLLAPQPYDSSSTNPAGLTKPSTLKTATASGTATPVPGNVQRALKPKPIKGRPQMPQRMKTAPGLVSGTGFTFSNAAHRNTRQPSFNARALDLASEIGDNKWGPTGDAGGLLGMPNSFSEQLLREREMERRIEEERRRSEEEEKGMVNRIMLARMNTLEEGFREVLKEIKDLSHVHSSSSRRDSEVDIGQLIQKGKQEKLSLDTSTSSAHVRTVKEMKTPVRHVSGVDMKSRKSPRKVQKRAAKGKNTEQPNSPADNGGESTQSPQSVESTGEPSKSEFTGANNSLERPGTAVHTPDLARRKEMKH